LRSHFGRDGFVALQLSDSICLVVGVCDRQLEAFVVRAEGLEPSRGYPQRIFIPATAFAAAKPAFVVWTIPSPWRRNPL